MTSPKPYPADELISDITILINHYYESAQSSVEALPDPDISNKGTGIEPNRAPLSPWTDLALSTQCRKLKGFKLSQPMYAKIFWLTTYLPHTSIKKIIKAGVETEIDRLIKLHYRNYGEISASL